MKKLILFTFLVTFLLLADRVNSQVAINSDGSIPNSSSMLDISSTSKGMLIPRMTSAQKTAIASPATGLMVYDTDTQSFWFYNGATWKNINTTSNSTLTLLTDKTAMTPEGGFAIKLTNKTGSSSVKGTIVCASTNSSYSFMMTPTGGKAYNKSIGAVYENGVADGSECWIVVSGIVEVLMDDGTSATAGNWACSSITTNGRATLNSDDPSSQDVHNREIGHVIETKSSGTNVLVKIVMHFN
jgi:hypothetical protein